MIFTSTRNDFRLNPIFRHVPHGSHEKYHLTWVNKNDNHKDNEKVYSLIVLYPFTLLMTPLFWS